MRVVAVLDTMWGDGERRAAPRFFSINTRNHSGRRLYRLVGDASLIVTNACRELVSDARQHGTPDPAWLAENLRRVEGKYDLLLVCGNIAQKTYRECGYESGARVLFIPHPAARKWTAALIEETRLEIERVPA